MGLALAAMSTLGWAADNPKAQAEERLKNAATVLQEIAAAPDKGIPNKVLDGAKCIAIVPKLVQAGFVFGGKHGRGVATCRTATGWSAPAFFTITGGSWGLQIGVEGVDLVMLIMNKQGMDHLMANKFQIGGEASAAAGPVGRDASANTDWKASTEMLTYSRAKGLFAGISLGGSWVARDADAMDAFYGANTSNTAILTGEVKPPAAATDFLAQIRIVTAKAEAKKAEK